MAVEQILVGPDNFSYLIYNEEEKLAALLDPGTNASKALGRIGHIGLELKYIINTHHHADHTADNRKVKNLHKCQIIASTQEKARHDIGVADGERLNLGSTKLIFLHTPGHTPGGLCVIVDNKYILTGDTLFIGDCGRTDLPGGSNSQMFDTLQMLKKLPDELIVYPGHDYGSRPFGSLGNQKKVNKALIAESLRELSAIP